MSLGSILTLSNIIGHLITFYYVCDLLATSDNVKYRATALSRKQSKKPIPLLTARAEPASEGRRTVTEPNDLPWRDS